MLLEVAPLWAVKIDRGPDWLFIRLVPPQGEDGDEFPLAEMIWDKLEQSFCHRVVVELDEVTFLRSWIVGELVKLHKRVVACGGMMRLSGLAPAHEEVLRACRLADRFPAYRTRTDALMGNRPNLPR